jgi:hypothetical protein
MEFDGLSQVTSMLATGQQIVQQMQHQQAGLEPVRNTLLPPPVQQEGEIMRECAREKLRAAIYGQVVLAATILSSKTHTSTEGVDVHTADVEFDFLAFFGVTPRDVLNTKGGSKMIYPPGMALLPDNTPILVKILSQDKTPVNGAKSKDSNSACMLGMSKTRAVMSPKNSTAAILAWYNQLLF